MDVRANLEDRPDEFLRRPDRNSLRLTGLAAAQACEAAAGAGLLIIGIEGGRWHNPGIEAWLDCLWTGKTGDHSFASADENNRIAASFIREEMGIERPGNMGVPDVFILTARRYRSASA